MKTIFFICLVFLFTSCDKAFDDHFWGDPNIYGSSLTSSDTSAKVKATISKHGIITQFSSAAGSMSRILFNSSDSILLYIYAADYSSEFRIYVRNIVTPGTYSFGHNPVNNKSIDIKYHYSYDTYSNSAELSGSLIIDSLTTVGMKGHFNVICRDGSDSVNISNGEFCGKFR